MFKEVLGLIALSLIVACSHSNKPVPLSEATFFVADTDQAKVKDIICDTCQVLGWNVSSASDEKILIDITKSNVTCFACITRQNNTYTIKPVRISCPPHKTRNARKLFDRYIKNLRKHLTKHLTMKL